MAKVEKIVAGADGRLYLLDDAGQVWQSKVGTPIEFERIKLPKELEPGKRESRPTGPFAKVRR